MWYFCPCWTCRLLTRCLQHEGPEGRWYSCAVGFSGEESRQFGKQLSCELGNCGWYCSFRRRECRAGKKKRKDKSSRDGRKDFKTNREVGMLWASGGLSYDCRMSPAAKSRNQAKGKEPEEICTRLWGSMQVISGRQQYRDNACIVHSDKPKCLVNACWDGRQDYEGLYTTGNLSKALSRESLPRLSTEEDGVCSWYLEEWRRRIAVSCHKFGKWNWLLSA